jgi:hypothetical protein
MVLTSKDLCTAYEKKLEAEFDSFLLANASKLYGDEQIEFTVQSENAADYLVGKYTAFVISHYWCPTDACCLENGHSKHHYVTVETVDN